MNPETVFKMIMCVFFLTGMSILIPSMTVWQRGFREIFPWGILCVFGFVYILLSSVYIWVPSRAPLWLFEAVATRPARVLVLMGVVLLIFWFVGTILTKHAVFQWPRDIGWIFLSVGVFIGLLSLRCTGFGC